MGAPTLSALAALIAAGAYFLGRERYKALVRGGAKRSFGSLPHHYGLLAAIWVAVPAAFLLLSWGGIEAVLLDRMLESALPPSATEGLSDKQIGLLLTQVKVGMSGDDPQLESARQVWAEGRELFSRIRAALVLAVALAAGAFAVLRLGTRVHARNQVERVIRFFLAASSWIAVLTTVGIFLSVVAETWAFFQHVSPAEFLFGTHWSPQTAIREDQAGSSGAFGSVPVFAGTILISLIALSVSVPVGLMSAIYLTEYAARSVRSVAKPALEVLAGIPTVVYGFFAVVTVAPAVQGLGIRLGLGVSSESALVAGLVMGVMIIPFVSSLSDDVIHAVPNSLRDGSLALGSTRSEMLRKVVLPAALPGIVGAILLAASRAIGETMIVVMAAGLAANLTINPLEAVTTATVQIVTLLVGDQEFGSAKTLSAFALGFALFLATLVFNMIALYIVKRYRERY